MMENLKKVTRTQWYLLVLLIGFAFLMQNCNEDDATIFEENQTDTELNAKPASNKVDVCRYNARKDSYSIVSVVLKRVLPGDVIIDADGDGYVIESACKNESDIIDCDDTNPAINSGADEICGDNIDNNCDGVVDEGCTLPSTYVPDDNFEQALIDLDFDDVLDDYVATANINKVTYLDIFQKNISDLTGIEGFTALQELTCWQNNLISLDLSQNKELIRVSCSNNALTSIDVSNSLSLEMLDCGDNQLTILNVSKNTALIYLACTDNQITNLDLSNNTALLDLQCNYNSLESLNIANCLKLVNLYCDENQLTDLVVDSMENLEYLGCSTNNLKSLSLNNTPALIGLWCHNNSLTGIDVSNNLALTTLWCHYNELTSLDVSNNTVLTELYCYDNPLLGCIQVNQTQFDNMPSYWYIGDAVLMLNCTPL